MKSRTQLIKAPLYQLRQIQWKSLKKKIIYLNKLTKFIQIMEMK